MKKIISSKNQSGGITAQKVKITTKVDALHVIKDPPRRNWIKIMSGSIILLSAFVGVLTYFGYTPDRNDKMDESNKDSVQVTSYNQSGGITANEVTINNMVKENIPELKMNLIHGNKKIDDYYETRAELYSEYPFSNLFFAAHAESIIELDISPMRAGIFMSGHSGKREGSHFTNIPNFQGKYLVIIKTSQPEKIELEYNDK